MKISHGLLDTMMDFPIVIVQIARGLAILHRELMIKGELEMLQIPFTVQINFFPSKSLTKRPHNGKLIQ